MNRTRRFALGPALAVACLAWPAAAQQARPVPSPLVPPVPAPAPVAAAIGLAEALALALRRNPEILVDETVVAANQGLLQSAGGAFDPIVSADAEFGDDRAGDLRQNSASIGVQQQLRNGVIVGGSVTGAAREPLLPGATPAAQAGTALTLLFPLLRGRGTEVVTANENIQRLALQSSRHALRETAAQQVFGAAQAYWRLRAAGETLAILVEAEARAERQVRDTQRLIDAGEQPAANIHLALATLNSRLAARLDGERALTEARLQLAQLMGLEPGAARGFETAADPFPRESGGPIGPQGLQQLLEAGLRQRYNLRAAEATLEARRLAVVASGDQLKPVLDGSVRLGFGGDAPANSAIEPLLRGRAGQRQVLAGLTWQWDVANNVAKGRYLSAAASHDQQVVVTQALRQSVALGIESAVAAYNSSLAQLAQSRQTVELFGRAVEGERVKLRLGSATLLDVVNLENSLQQARTAHVNTMAAHATAIAALRFQVGELIRGEGETQLIPMDQLLAWQAPPAAPGSR